MLPQNNRNLNEDSYFNQIIGREDINNNSVAELEGAARQQLCVGQIEKSVLPDNRVTSPQINQYVRGPDDPGNIRAEQQVKQR